MSKLRKLTPLHKVLGPSAKNMPHVSRDAERASRSPWRKWYGLTRWKQMRWRVLTAANFTCAICGRVEPNHSKLVADHVRPHRGRSDMFWDEDNLQCLCDACHGTVKQAEEAREPPGVWD